jgi:hypothetical protein
MYFADDPESVEKYSSAVTLSDMEVFIFPELMFSLVLANIMSPLAWQWKKDSWFKDLEKKGPYRRLHRTKQFIMDRFSFNLDLDTWGLTNKKKELKRFSSFVDEEILARSNALFGYEGDKYYFDLDIRRHFGLDKYNSDIIPYWKTETVEAMDAFKYKEGYPAGAGECVSLAALYTSLLFVIAEIPLSSIYMLATPLHSQNFIDIKDGIITNNRRLVTKNMWFNGTEMSDKAKRALQNEKVTIVVNNTGYIHTMYKKATISPDAYRGLSKKLGQYLTTDISFEILANFLRHNSKIQKCFQIVHRCCGKPRFIEAEKVFHYEHSSKLRIGGTTQEKLLHEIDEDEFYPSPIQGRILLDDIESFFKKGGVSLDSTRDIENLKTHLSSCCYNVEEVIGDLKKFCRIEPDLPDAGKHWVEQEPLILDKLSRREEIVEYLETMREKNLMADLAFTASRDMKRAPWKPFLKAAIERNPVSIEGSKDLDTERLAEKLWMMENESIYDTSRLAQPDEVWNYNRGDGIEKAICLMNVLNNRFPDDEITLEGDGKKVCVTIGKKEYTFQTSKELDLPEKSDFDF